VGTVSGFADRANRPPWPTADATPLRGALLDVRESSACYNFGMPEDRFERALSEANASRLIHDVHDVGRASRDRLLLESWSLSLTKRLDEIMEAFPSFGSGPGYPEIEFEPERSATLAYRRSGLTMKMTVTANAHLEGDRLDQKPRLIGDDFRDGSAVMEVAVEIVDTKQISAEDFRYGLQPVDHFVSISSAEHFLDLVERLVSKAGCAPDEDNGA